MGIIERVLPEKELGKEAFYSTLREELHAKLAELEAIPLQELTERRYRRFRALGTRQLAGE